MSRASSRWELERVEAQHRGHEQVREHDGERVTATSGEASVRRRDYSPGRPGPCSASGTPLASAARPAVSPRPVLEEVPCAASQRSSCARAGRSAARGLSPELAGRCTRPVRLHRSERKSATREAARLVLLRRKRSTSARPPSWRVRRIRRAPQGAHRVGKPTAGVRCAGRGVHDAAGRSALMTSTPASTEAVALRDNSARLQERRARCLVRYTPHDGPREGVPHRRTAVVTGAGAGIGKGSPRLRRSAPESPARARRATAHATLRR